MPPFIDTAVRGKDCDSYIVADEGETETEGAEFMVITATSEVTDWNLHNMAERDRYRNLS